MILYEFIQIHIIIIELNVKKIYLFYYEINHKYHDMINLSEFNY